MIDQDRKPDIIENLIIQLGEFSPYQRCQFSLHVIGALLTGLHIFSSITIAAIPEHRCEVPNVDINKSMADLNISTLTRYIPLKTENKIDSCSVYSTVTNKSVKCNSWVYNTTYHPSSRAIEWNSVCDRRWMGALSQTVFMMGLFLGNFVLGNLADRVGRKPVYCWSALITLILAVAVAFTRHYYLFLVVRFILGMVAGTGIITGFVMTMELVGSSKRCTIGVLYQILFACGVILVAFWGWIIKDIQSLQIIYGLHGLPTIIHWWLMDESPRWLWASGRHQECLQVLQKGLSFNGSSIKLDIANLIPQVPVQQSRKAKKSSALDLFRKPNMRKRMLSIGLCWFAVSLVYYGLSLGTGSMTGNPFLIMFIMGAIEIPGDILVLILLDRLGRRLLMTLTMIGSGFCCILAANVTVGGIASNSLVYSGKFFISISYCVIYVYSAELFPTVTRNSAIGIAHMCSRVSGSLSPLITLLDSFDPTIPSIIFGVITIFSGCLIFFLPETLGTIMPSTIEDGERFGLGDTCFTNFLGRKQIIRDVKDSGDQRRTEQVEPLNFIENC